VCTMCAFECLKAAQGSSCASPDESERVHAPSGMTKAYIELVLYLRAVQLSKRIKSSASIWSATGIRSWSKKVRRHNKNNVFPAECN